jgi:AcrR family transcriptional regulator
MARMPSAERRRQLTEAAIRAMTRDGVSRTTTRSIAAEAGLSLSVFHYCFDSKQALIESVITTITEHSVTVVREAIRPKATLRETVRAGFQAYWDHVSAHPGEHMLTYELTQYALRQPGFEHLARRQYQLYCDTYTELVEQLAREHGLRTPRPGPRAGPLSGRHDRRADPELPRAGRRRGLGGHPRHDHRPCRGPRSRRGRTAAEYRIRCRRFLFFVSLMQPFTKGHLSDERQLQ